MDSRTADGAHPAFVEIIRQLTSDEARLVRLFIRPRALPLINVRWEYKKETPTERGGQDLLSNFSLLGYEAGCQLPDLTPTYINNLCRLGLADIPTFLEYTAQGIYDPLENHPTVLALKNRLENDEKRKFEIERKGLQVSALGKQFCKACVLSHEQKGLPKKARANE
jgi:hypothetical protein